jgi:hypothetical protein
MGDAVYLSLCVYGGPTDGRWSNRIVSKINNREMTFGPDQTFEVVLGGPKRAGNWIPLDEDAVALVTRDYLIDPVHGVQARYAIEAIDPVAPPPGPPTPSWRSAAARRSHPRPDEHLAGARSTQHRAGAVLQQAVTTAGPRPTSPTRWPLAARRRRGARHRGALARLRVLEPLPVEPLHVHVRLPLPPLHGERRPGALRGRRLVARRRRGARPGTSELALDGGTRAGTPLVPLVPAGGDAGTADGARGEGGGRPR